MARKRQHSPPASVSAFAKRLRTTVPECFAHDDDEKSYNPFDEAEILEQRKRLETVFDVPELLSQIFSYLHTPQLITVMVLVCKSWYSTIYDHIPSVLTRLYLDADPSQIPQHHSQYVKKQPLIFKKRSSNNDITYNNTNVNKYYTRSRVEAYTTFPLQRLNQNLIHINISGMHYKHFDEMLSNLIKNGHLSKVQTFTLNDVPYLNAIEHVPKLCQRLEKLTLTNLPNLEQRSVKMILAHASRLSDLQIRNCVLNHFQRLALPKESEQLRNFETLPSLRKLYLEGCTASLFRTGKAISAGRDGSGIPPTDDTDSCHEFTNLQSMHLVKFTVTRSSGLAKSAPELFYTPNLVDLNLTDIQFHQGIVVTDDPKYQNILQLTANAASDSEDDRHKPVLIQSKSIQRLTLNFDGSATSCSVGSPTTPIVVENLFTKTGNTTPVQTLIQCPEVTELRLSRIDLFYRLQGIEQCVNLRKLHVSDWQLQLHKSTHKQVYTSTKRFVFKHLEELVLERFSTTTNEMPEWDCPKLKIFFVTCVAIGGLRKIKAHFPQIEDITIHVTIGPCEIDMEHLDKLQRCDIRCDKLRDLRIAKCKSWLTHDQLEQIVLASPFLDTLILNHCDALRYVNIKKSHSTKLNTFAIRNCPMVGSVHIPAQTMAQFYAVQCPRLQLINLGTRKEDIGFFRISGISNIYRMNYITI
jgi:hypothetical protein